MHGKYPEEMSALEKMENRVRSVEDAMAENGIEIKRIVPIVLGRKPRGTPALSMTVSKPDGRQIRLVTKQQSTDDIGLQDWDVDITIKPGAVESGMRNVEGWVELTDARLMGPQIVWDQGKVDVEDAIKPGDRVNLQFNGLEWRAEAVITRAAGSRISFAEQTPHPLRDWKAIGIYNEYRPGDRLLDLGHGELVLEKAGIMGKTVIKGWSGGRPGPNRALNERLNISGSIALPGERNYNPERPGGPAPTSYRTIDVWCPRYRNSSKDGISMEVELPIRGA